MCVCLTSIMLYRNAVYILRVMQRSIYRI